MEWEYYSKPARWVLTSGGWLATVERVAGSGVTWSTRVEHLVEPHDRYDGPTLDDPMRGRTWCLTKIAELKIER